MGIAIPQVITSDRASGTQVIDGSLKFDSASSNYLKRTPSFVGNRKTFTVSTWIKRSKIGSNTNILGAGDAGTNYTVASIVSDAVFFQVNNGGGDQVNVSTSGLLRDASAFYHIVLAVDLT